MTRLTPADTQPHFRRSEMRIVHDMFRREFALMPGLVLGVAAGDHTRAHIIGDHITGMTSFLHTHHVLEDDNVWPLLLDRCGESVASMVELMESHHRQLARLTPRVDEAVSVWCDSPTVIPQQALVDVLDQLIPALKEHLNAEENSVVPLMEQHITAAEWTGFLKNESGAVDPDNAPLILGMMMYEGDPESVEQVIAAKSTDISPTIRELAASTFAAHSQRIHGTATPPRSTEL
jgi:hemerythrin-like domain-containing protein